MNDRTTSQDIRELLQAAMDLQDASAARKLADKACRRAAARKRLLIERLAKNKGNEEIDIEEMLKHAKASDGAPEGFVFPPGHRWSPEVEAALASMDDEPGLLKEERQ